MSPTALYGQWKPVIVVTLLALLALMIAIPYFRRHLPAVLPVARLRLGHVVGAFGLYLATALIVGSLLPLIVHALFSIKQWPSQNAGVIGWMQLATLWSMAIVLWLCTRLWRSGLVVEIFWDHLGLKQRALLPALAKGALMWLVAFPCVVATGQLVTQILRSMGREYVVEQSAVRFLQSTQPYPLLFTCTALTIVVVIPLAEEFLFRGCLQNWLKGLLGTRAAIVATAALFAFFHYSATQGIGNIEIIASLFVFALFLGRLYEGFRTLWVNVGLHATFNAITILTLIFE